MLRTTLTAAALTVAAAPAAAQAPDARAVLERATEAARALTSARYQAEAVLAGTSSRRVVRGSVSLTRFPFSDTIGGQLAIRGEVDGARRGGETRFEITYDGERVRRLRPEANILLMGDVNFGGEALLAGSSRILVLNELLAGEPYALERSRESLSYEGRESVGGVDCHVLHVVLEESGTSIRWHFGVDDTLPRRREHHYRSASGKPVTATLTVAKLEVGVEFPEGEFVIEPPADAKVETVGRSPPPPLRVGQPTPDFTLTDADGETFQLSSQRGKVVVLEFFSTNCPHCERSMPTLQELHERYAARGLSLAAIHCRDGTGADPVGFAARGGAQFPVLLEGNAVAIQYSVRGIPVVLVIGPDGNLLYQQTGFAANSKTSLSAVIEQNLP